MRIALLGAPGAGKTEVAKALARNLTRDGLPVGGKWKVIDGYVDRLSARTGTTYGPYAGYLQNLQILCERLTLEDEAINQGYSIITCGSIYDTLTYTLLLNVVPPADETARLSQAEVSYLFMSVFGLIEPSILYDRLFYLPLSEQEHSMHGVISAKIPDVLSSLNRQATILTGTRREQVRDALKVTRFIRDEVIPRFLKEAAVDDQPAV